MQGFYPTGEAVAANGFEPMGALLLKAVLANGAVPLTGTEATKVGVSTIVVVCTTIGAVLQYYY